MLSPLSPSDRRLALDILQLLLSDPSSETLLAAPLAATTERFREAQTALALGLGVTGDYGRQLRVSMDWLTKVLQRPEDLALPPSDSAPTLHDPLDALRALKDFLVIETELHLRTDPTGTSAGLPRTQLRYDESERYAAHLNLDHFDALLERLPDVVLAPALTHNLCDILIEAQGHHGALDKYRPRVIQALRRAERRIDLPPVDRLRVYEVFGVLGLCAKDTEFYEKYQRELLNQSSGASAEEVLRKTSWWVPFYYNDSVDTAIEEHRKTLATSAYGMVRVHMGRILAGTAGLNFHAVVEESGLEEDRRFLFGRQDLIQTRNRLLSRFPRAQVLVIHGHDEARWRELADLLRAEHLKPVVLWDEPSMGTSTIIEKLERYAERCVYAFAVLTPDDQLTNEDEHHFQPRANVLFEVGWFLARFGRQRVSLLLKRGTRLPSDLAGLQFLEFDSRIEQCLRGIRSELRAASLLPL